MTETSNQKENKLIGN